MFTLMHLCKFFSNTYKTHFKTIKTEFKVYYLYISIYINKNNRQKYY